MKNYIPQSSKFTLSNLINTSQPMMRFQENFSSNCDCNTKSFKSPSTSYNYPVLDKLSTCVYTPQGNLVCSANTFIGIPKSFEYKDIGKLAGRI